MLKKIFARPFIAMLLVSATASGHHSMAMFEPVKEQVLIGTIIKYEWTNPHVWIEMDVVDESGKSMQWSIESGSLVGLKRQGWKSTTLKPGDNVTIAIHPLRDGRPGGSLIGMIAADGKLYGKPVIPPAAK